jgi:hypothetical protein
VVGADNLVGVDVANAAPPENKKNNLLVFVTINRPPLWGFKAFRVFAGR